VRDASTRKSRDEWKKQWRRPTGGEVGLRALRAPGEATLETIKSLMWLPFGLVLAAGVAFVVVVLLKIVLPGRHKPEEPDE
jgi:hypothetical protein